MTTGAGRPVRTAGTARGAAPRRPFRVPAVAPEDPAEAVGNSLAGTGARPSGDAAPVSPAARRSDTPDVTGAAARPGTQTWRLDIPVWPPFLTMNTGLRAHWGARQSMNERMDNAVGILARQQRIPRLERADMAVEYVPPPKLKKHRHPYAGPRIEDHDGLSVVAKSLVDAVVSAGLLPGDSKKRVTSVTCRLLEGSHPKGRLWLVITGEAARD